MVGVLSEFLSKIFSSSMDVNAQFFLSFISEEILNLNGTTPKKRFLSSSFCKCKQPGYVYKTDENFDFLRYRRRFTDARGSTSTFKEVYTPLDMILVLSGKIYTGSLLGYIYFSSVLSHRQCEDFFDKTSLFTEIQGLKTFLCKTIPKNKAMQLLLIN